MTTPREGHIRVQFFAEAMLLGLLGGAVGVGLGAAATAVYAHLKHSAIIIPTIAWAGGLAAALAIGAIARLLPALRAARMSPPRPCGPCEEQGSVVHPMPEPGPTAADRTKRRIGP